MWRERNGYDNGVTQFFYLALSHDSLANYYQTNFAMMQYHKYNLAELESMMPFEREIYLSMLTAHVKEENDKIKDQ